MKMALNFMVIIFAWFILAVPCQGQEKLLLFKDGRTLLGEVLESTSDSVKFKHKSGEKKVVETFRASDLDPGFFYAVRNEVVGNNADARLELAKFALENEMYLATILQYERAKDLDSALVEKFDKEEAPLLLENAANKLLQSAKKAIEKKDFTRAENDISTILTHFPETEAAKNMKEFNRKFGEKLPVLQEKKDGDENLQSLTLRNGRTMKGVILENNEDSIKFEFTFQGEKAVSSFHARQIDPLNFYDMRKKAVGNDPAGHLKLAKFCAENGLYTLASFQYQVAKALDAKCVEEFEKTEWPVISERIAADLLANAKKAVKKKDYTNAKRDLGVVLVQFSDTNAGREARDYLDELEKLFLSKLDAKTAALMKKATKEEKEALKERLKLIAPAEKLVTHSHKVNYSALKDKNSSKAARDFESAAKKCENALKMLDRLEKSHGSDSILLEIIDSLRKDAREEGIGAYINAGNILIVRGSYKQANRLAKKALAIDPGSQSAQTFQARVESAAAMASTEWGSRWRIRR